MIRLFSVEFWMAVLFFVNFSLVLFILMFIRKVNRFWIEHTLDGEGGQNNDPVRDTASDIMDMLEPLVKESRDAAILFDEQIKDKYIFPKEILEKLESLEILIY